VPIPLLVLSLLGYEDWRLETGQDPGEDSECGVPLYLHGSNPYRVGGEVSSCRRKSGLDPSGHYFGDGLVRLRFNRRYTQKPYHPTVGGRLSL
jgi:hypothetical protein